MFIRRIELTHFRCFAQKYLNFEKDVVLIEGANGSGKTSLLEALHYACYLRSFRTHSPRELVAFEQSTFSIKLLFDQMYDQEALSNQLHVGYTHKKRVVTLNNKPIHSYKELMDHVRIITVTEDDLDIIKLGPEFRRDFIDQAILLYDPDYIRSLKEYKIVLENRNKLLQSNQIDGASHHIWTEQLWAKTGLIQDRRKEFLSLLQEEVQTLLKIYFTYELHISCTYKPKLEHGSSAQEIPKTLFDQEKRFGRSLFGAHLDDILITFQGSTSRIFASRGQQKLILLLIKIAQLAVLKRKKGAALLLLDDFMTDFDQERAEIALHALSATQVQRLFTVPLKSSRLTGMLEGMGAQIIDIST